MAYYNNGSYFGDFAGGYRQTPGGFIIPSNVNSLGLSYPSFPGANLPSVDPNNYPGTIHFGPSSEIIGPSSFNQYPLGGVYDAPVIGAPMY